MIGFSMPKAIDTIVGFDLDDTLVPEVLFLKSGIRHIAEWLKTRFPKVEQNRIVQCMDTAMLTRRNHYSALETYLYQTGLSEKIDMKEVVAEFRCHKPDPSIYHLPPSMEHILTQLRESGIKTVLITDGRSITQRNKIEAAGLLRFFDNGDIYISEETGHDKNDPDTFRIVMQKYAGAAQFHYVGDNPAKDFLHPSRLGWHTHMVHPFPLAIHQGIPK